MLYDRGRQRLIYLSRDREEFSFFHEDPRATLGHLFIYWFIHLVTYLFILLALLIPSSDSFELKKRRFSDQALAVSIRGNNFQVVYYGLSLCIIFNFFCPTKLFAVYL